MRLADKVGVVTGGESGIGKGVARAMAAEGAMVVIGGIQEELGEDVAATIRAEGGHAIFHKTDVTKPEECAAMVQRAEDEFGGLDLAFNNAGGQGAFNALHETPVEEASWWIDVDLKGVFYCLKYETASMLKRGGGAVVNTASIFGLKAVPRLSHYVAAKHGVIGLTRAAALDYADQHIRVNAVCPGPIKTPSLDRASGGDDALYEQFVPMRRIGQPEEVAQSVVWLLSDDAVFVTGAILSVDGGMAAG